MSKLSNAVVMTSQAIAFMHAGAEMIRTKGEEHNSYNLPDNVNQIDWSRKSEYENVVKYYQNLINLRKEHPAFRMRTAEDIRNNLEFKKVENGLITYQISNNANGDSWKDILVIYNARTKEERIEFDESWSLAVLGDAFDLDGKLKIKGINIPPISMAVFFKN